MSDSRKAGIGIEEQQKLTDLQYAINGADPRMLLEALRAKGGALMAIADAALIALKKGGDYNNTEKAPGAERDVYFPFGDASYAQMIHVKTQRIVSLVQKQASGGSANFEGLEDTALDQINYCSFFVDYLRRRRGMLL